MKGQCAALYLRSSKDRSDVSIEAQRRQLKQFALERGLRVVAEFADVVESGKDDYRPGFRQLLAAMKAPRREWSVLLLLDTSRLARRRLTSIMFEEIEAKRAGIAIIYKNLPELDAAESMLLRNQLQGLDEYHSLVSKRKGLAGMATNVENGYRAGGRAPRGYALRHTGTGAIREGREVLKSRLEPAADAPIVARYLQARAAGRSRRALKTELGIGWADTSLIGLEWNALTYAGHTVWNVHNEFQRGHGYRQHQKRRPRSEWIIKRDTHPALITEAEAEAILAALEASVHHLGGKYRTPANYLLSGLLTTPDGRAWRGNGGGRYRAKEWRRNVAREDIEPVVLRQMIEDLCSRGLAAEMAEQAQHLAQRHDDDPAAELRAQIADRGARIARMMDLAARMSDPDPALREIERLEAERKQFAQEIARVDVERAGADELRALTEAQMHKLLADVAARLETAHRETAKDLIATLVERVELCPQTLACRVVYRHAAHRRDEIGIPGRPQGDASQFLYMIRALRALKAA